MKSSVIWCKEISYNSEFPNQESLSMDENIFIPAYNIFMY